MVMHTGNSEIKAHFWIVIPLIMKQDAIQLQLLVCDTEARGGILFGEDTFDQLGCWKYYTNRILYIIYRSVKSSSLKDICPCLNVYKLYPFT